MKRKIRIIAGGIFGAKGEVPIGTEFEVKGDLPSGWAGRFVELGNDDGKTLQIGTGDASIASNDLARLLHEHGLYETENVTLKAQVEKLTAELAAHSKPAPLPSPPLAGDAAADAEAEAKAKAEAEAEAEAKAKSEADAAEAAKKAEAEKRPVGRPAGKKA